MLFFSPYDDPVPDYDYVKVYEEGLYWCEIARWSWCEGSGCWAALGFLSVRWGAWLANTRPGIQLDAHTHLPIDSHQGSHQTYPKIQENWYYYNPGLCNCLAVLDNIIQSITNWAWEKASFCKKKKVRQKYARWNSNVCSSQFEIYPVNVFTVFQHNFTPFKSVISKTSLTLINQELEWLYNLHWHWMTSCVI